MLATSTPADASAANARAGARNVNSFDAGVPRSVIAVSRLTTARSAADRIGAIGASIPVGLVSSCARNIFSKCTSPPNAIVTGWPLPRRPRGAVVVVVDGAVLVEGATVAAVEEDEAPRDPPAPSSAYDTNV